MPRCLAKVMVMTNNLEPITWNYCPNCGERLVLRQDDHEDRPHCARCQRYYYSNPTPAVCCFVTRADEILLGQRGVEPRRGYWGLPGGYVELGETAEEAALRELLEETELRGARPSLIGVSSQQSRFTGAVIVLGYIIEQWEGDPRPGSDVTAVRFFPKAQLPRLPFRAHRELYAIFDAIQSGATQSLPTTPQTQPIATPHKVELPPQNR